MTQNTENTNELLQEPSIDEFAELDEVDKHILKLRIQFPAMSVTKLAERIGIHRSTAERRLAKETMKKALADYENRDLLLAMNNRREVMKLQQKAINAIGDMLESGDPQERAFALDKIDIMKGIIPDLSEVTATHNLPNSIKIEFEGDE